MAVKKTFWTTTVAKMAVIVLVARFVWTGSDMFHIDVPGIGKAPVAVLFYAVAAVLGVAALSGTLVRIAAKKKTNGAAKSTP